MQMLYDSRQYVVVAIEVPSGPEADAQPALSRGGYEIVDKLARKEIFLQGELAAFFQEGVQRIVASGPTEEALDEFIGRYTVLAQQPVVMH